MGLVLRKPTAASSPYMLLNERKETAGSQNIMENRQQYVEGRHQILDKDGRLNTPNFSLSQAPTNIAIKKLLLGSGEVERRQVT